MILSASQVTMIFGKWKPNSVIKPQDFNDTCERKWLLAKILKVPQPSRSFTTFGSILHAVVERYLLADDNGNVNGKPVDMYPEGWDKGLKLQSERDLIKALVEKAEEQGILERYEDRFVEQCLTDGTKYWDDFGEKIWKLKDDLWLTGFIDYHHSGNVIEDWKTSSNPVKYGLNSDPKSVNFLGYDIQGLMYCLWVDTFRESHDRYVLRHNYFDTKSTPEDPKVFQVEVTISRAVVQQFGRWLNKTADYMYSLKNKTFADAESLYRGDKACDKYRGCAYKKICNGQLTIEQHTKLIQQQEKNEENKTMSNPMLEKIKAAAAAKKALEAGTKVELPAEKLTKKVEPVVVQKISSMGKTEDMTVGALNTRGDIKVEPVVEKKVEPETKAAPKKRAPKKKTGFCLFINCFPSKGFKTTVTIQEVLTDMRVDNKISKMWDRIDFYTQNLDMILPELDGKNIVATHCSTESNNFLDLLIPHSDLTVEG